MKSFFWQSCSGSLPTALNLRTKSVNCSTLCHLCSTAEEDCYHIFADCAVARDIWARLDFHLPLNNMNSFSSWIDEVFTLLNDSQVPTFITCCWSLWKARNDKLWNNLVTSNLVIMERAISYLKEWLAASNLHNRIPQTQEPSLQNWEKPPLGWLKVNIDADLDEAGGCMDFGWVVRKDNGNFVVASCKRKHGYFLPKEAEAFAISEALSWLKSHNMDKCHLESDCFLVVNNMNYTDHIAYLDLIMADIKDACNQFSDISISFVRRSANRVAHELAREALSTSDCAEWFHTPSFICNALLSDE